MKQELVIGEIRTAHGVRGELKVESLSGETDHFRKLTEVILVRGQKRHEARVEAIRIAHRTVLMKLEGVENPEEAKKWRGWEIAVPREAAAPLAEDEYYFADIVGLDVIFESSTVGVVKNVWEGGPSPLLGIETQTGEQRLVPFQSEFVENVDLQMRRLTLTTNEVLE